jgi:protein-S-isoprenylcysteine O-methyltransferase Ste14
VTPLLLFLVLWAGFAVSWLLAAFWRAPAVHTERSASVWLYRALLLLGAVLLNYRAARLLHAHRLWHVGYRGAYVLALLMLPGFAFAWWGRLHLGRLWSSAVTRKADHRVIDTGPYGIVRHPIYTGILLACLLSAIAVGAWTSIVGFVLMTAGFWLKARIEEAVLSRELGAEYAAYRSRVPMLLPFSPVR